MINLLICDSKGIHVTFTCFKGIKVHAGALHNAEQWTKLLCGWCPGSESVHVHSGSWMAQNRWFWENEGYSEGDAVQIPRVDQNKAGQH